MNLNNSNLIRKSFEFIPAFCPPGSKLDRGRARCQNRFESVSKSGEGLKTKFVSLSFHNFIFRKIQKKTNNKYRKFKTTKSSYLNFAFRGGSSPLTPNPNSFFSLFFLI